MKNAEPLFATAADRLRARDTAGAEALMRQALALRPDHAPGFRQLALSSGAVFGRRDRPA